MQTFNLLLTYPAFKGLIYLASALCVLLVGFIAVVVMSHVAFSLGRRSTLYAKRQPAKGWSKRFYPASVVVILVLLVLAFWLRSLV